MARPCYSLTLVAMLLASFVSCISANLNCEDLPLDLCAFAVATTGSRCVLEKQILRNGNVKYNCLTSEEAAPEFAEWVETDHCVQSCGIKDRLTVGMSSDALVERGFIKALCSAECQNGCPNMVDLFEKLALEEGVSLSHVCKAQAGIGGARREMDEVNFASLSASSLNAWEAPSPSAV